LFKNNILKIVSTLLVFLLLLFPSVSAQSLNQELTEIQNIINVEFSDIFENDNLQDKLIVIVGSQVSGVERIAVEIIKKQIDKPEVLELLIQKDTDSALQQALQTTKTIFLIGGPSQNLVTKKLIRDGLVQSPQTEKAKIIAVARGTNSQGSKIVVFSDLRGFNNIERESAYLSPLARFIPVEYVPAAASLIAIILAYLVGFIKRIIGNYIIGFGKKQARIKEDYIGFKVRDFNVKLREYMAIFLGASIFGMAIALSYTGLQITVLQTFKFTAVACLLIFIIREGIRLLLSYSMKLHMEFKLWITGDIISLISGFLGNTLNTTSFVMEVKDKDYSFEKATKIKYWVVLLTFVGGTIFFVLNLLDPSKFNQMLMASATTLGLADIIPIKPLLGVDIKKWKPGLWFFTILIMVILYIIMNFVV